MNVFVHYFGLASKLFGAPINNTQELLLLPSNKISNEKKHTHTEIYSLGKQNRTSEKKNVGRRQSFGGRMNVIYMCFQEGWKTWGKRYFMKIHAVSQRQQQQQKKIKIKHTHRCHSKCVSIRVCMVFSLFGHEKNKQTLFSFTPIHKCKRVVYVGPNSRMLCFNILK